MDRIRRLQSLMQREGVDGMAFNAGPSLGYLTGLHFHLMERPVLLIVPASGVPGLILPELERQKLVGRESELRSFCYGDDPALWKKTFSDGFEEVGLSRGSLGVEPRQMRLLEYDFIHGAAPELVARDCSELIASLRCRKDAQEIEAHRRAVRVAEKALQATLPMIKRGVTEKEIAAALFCNLLNNGSDPGLPFEPIVAAGPNGANPHSTPTNRPLREGDLLIVDWGASCDGYVSDLTRTFGIGRVGEKEQKIFDAVFEANLAGRKAGKPGLACGSVDDAARKCIENAGYGEFFTHRTGHGFGLECHEEPYMFAGNNFVLQAGMTYTVEPGIYLPGRNGVRIEDDVLVTEDGAESLSTMERELVVLD